MTEYEWIAAEAHDKAIAWNTLRRSLENRQHSGFKTAEDVLDFIKKTESQIFDHIGDCPESDKQPTLTDLTNVVLAGWKD